MRPASAPTAPTALLNACTTGFGLGCGALTGCPDEGANASAGACVVLSVFAPFSEFTDGARRSASLGVSAGTEGPFTSAFATTPWAADLLESLVGNSSFGVGRCTTPAASIATFAAGLTGGKGASLACAATPE